jgi:hypothetical protein
VKEYKKKHNKDAICVLETDWMSDEISALDTDDDQKKASHRQRLIQASRLPPAHQDQAIWEVVRPEFQSTEVFICSCSLNSLTTAVVYQREGRIRCHSQEAKTSLQATVAWSRHACKSR